ncbi:MAG: M3 family oligoendopeptidase [Truepera sp.]|nr:M3 family oligoendopeptidase [Truepera sp.]
MSNTANATDQLQRSERATWSQFEARFQALLDSDLKVEGAESWIRCWSELETDIYEEEARLYRAKDENTADREAEAAYLEFSLEVLPEVERASQRLKERLLALEGYTPPPDQEELLKVWRSDATLFTEANVAVKAEERALANEFNKLKGSLSVEFGGETLTIPQVQLILQRPDREARERAWHAIQAAEASVSDQLGDLFERLLANRRLQAENAGFTDYRAFRWRELGRFDYTPEESLTLHDAIATEVVPRAAELAARRRHTLGLDSLRPWDLACDMRGRSPLVPFVSISELEEGLERMFRRLDPVLGEQFASLRDGWLDLEPRLGKVPGSGYQLTFPRSGKPYIYWSAVGSDDDLVTMRHEAGHAFHALAAHERQSLLWNQRAGAEFSEVASEAMELLTLPHLTRKAGGFYTTEDADRSKAELIERILNLLPTLALRDTHQHWIYTQAPEGVTADDIGERWSELYKRFLPFVDWSDLEAEQARAWKVIHLFGYPFYMLEYGIAYLGAIQIWRASLEDPEGTLARYREALALGGTRPLPELFSAAGARLVFDREGVAELMDFVMQQFPAGEAPQ